MLVIKTESQLKWLLMLCVSLMEKFWKSVHIVCNFLMYSGAFITRNCFSLLREIIKIQRQKQDLKEGSLTCQLDYFSLELLMVYKM